MVGRNSKLVALLAGAASVAAGCAGGDRDQTSEDPGATATRVEPVGPPTFARDVAPILWENCVVCHRPESSAPFSLLSHAEARDRAQDIALVVEDRYMPPWLPEPGYGDFRGERRLSDEQIETVLDWVGAGAPEGDPDDLPAPPQLTDGWQLGEPDLVVEMPEAFSLQPGDGDVFRNFVIPTPDGPRRYVRSIEMNPGNPRVVHHAVLTVDETDSSRELDAVDSDVGFYTSMDAAGNAHSPAGQFLGWTPGLVPEHGPEGLAWGLRGGTDLVLQLHMLPGAEAEPVRSSIGVFYTDRVPVEQPFVLRLGSMDIDVPPGVADYTIEDEYVLPVDVRALGVYPHAHYLARDMKGYAILPDGRREWLIWIREWDFLQQDWYAYAEPVLLPAGTTLRMEYTYDNTAENPRNPNRPPERVVYGPNSGDEMGDLWIQVLPVDPARLTTLEDHFLGKERARDIRMLRRSLDEDPGDATALYNLGVLLHADGSRGEAEQHYRRALAIDPDLADAHNNLATLLLLEGRNREAVDHLQQALRIEPDSADVYRTLGRIYLAQGATTDAITLFLRGIEIDPGMWELHAELAAAYVRNGDNRAALASYRAAVAIEPDEPTLRVVYGEVLGADGRMPEAEEQFRIALTLAPQDARAHNNLGMAHEQQGRFAEAIASYRRALAIDPALAGARENLDRALRRRAPQ